MSDIADIAESETQVKCFNGACHENHGRRGSQTWLKSVTHYDSQPMLLQDPFVISDYGSFGPPALGPFEDTNHWVQHPHCAGHWCTEIPHCCQLHRLLCESYNIHRYGNPGCGWNHHLEIPHTNLSPPPYFSGEYRTDCAGYDQLGTRREVDIYERFDDVPDTPVELHIQDENLSDTTCHQELLPNPTPCAGGIYTQVVVEGGESTLGVEEPSRHTPVTSTKQTTVPSASDTDDTALMDTKNQSSLYCNQPPEQQSESDRISLYYNQLPEQQSESDIQTEAADPPRYKTELKVQLSYTAPSPALQSKPQHGVYVKVMSTASSVVFNKPRVPTGISFPSGETPPSRDNSLVTDKIPHSSFDSETESVEAFDLEKHKSIDTIRFPNGSDGGAEAHILDDVSQNDLTGGGLEYTPQYSQEALSVNSTDGTCNANYDDYSAPPLIQFGILQLSRELVTAKLLKEKNGVFAITKGGKCGRKSHLTTYQMRVHSREEVRMRQICLSLKGIRMHRIYRFCSSDGELKGKGFSNFGELVQHYVSECVPGIHQKLTRPLRLN